MNNRFSEERELLKDLRQKERSWKIIRWVLPFVSLYLLFGFKTPADPLSVRFVLGLGLLAYVCGRWNGDPTSRLLIKLYEEKLENEFLEEEIANFKSNPSRQV